MDIRRLFLSPNNKHVFGFAFRLVCLRNFEVCKSINSIQFNSVQCKSIQCNRSLVIGVLWGNYYYYRPEHIRSDSDYYGQLIVSLGQTKSCEGDVWDHN